jgi:hypothetical protein
MSNKNVPASGPKTLYVPAVVNHELSDELAAYSSLDALAEGNSSETGEIVWVYEFTGGKKINLKVSLV